MNVRTSVVEATRRPGTGTAPLPKVIYVELADYCNLSCTFCERSAYVATVGKGGFIEVEQLEKLEQPLRAAKVLGLSGRVGEPLLHPKLERILAWVFEINPGILLRITTNGTALSCKLAGVLGGHIDFLAISLNAASAEMYVRDMRPVGYKGGDASAWWGNLIRRITEFIAALPASDRERVRIISPVHRDNIHTMFDFVRLVSSMGCSHAIITPMFIHEESKMDASIYWMKDRYNDLMDEVEALGAKLGMRVEAARFYSHPKLESLDLATICREPLETAYLNMEKLGKTAPCCHWSEDAIPMDVYSDARAFERFWNSDFYQKLRRKRDFKSCQNCSMGRAFDEMLFHLTPALQYRLAASGRIAGFEIQNAYPDSKLVGVCRSLSLDLRSLRRTALALGVATERLNSLVDHGLEALTEIDRACWDAFLGADTPAAPTVDVALGGCFSGIGWFEPDNDPASSVSARWMGGGRSASVFVRVVPGYDYELRVTAHHLRSDEMAKGLSLAALGRPLKVELCIQSNGTTVLTAVVPKDIATVFDGHLWLTIGYDDSRGHEGWVSFSRIEAFASSAQA